MNEVRKAALKSKVNSQAEKTSTHLDPLTGSPVSKIPSKIARISKNTEMDVSGHAGFVHAGQLVGAGAGVGWAAGWRVLMVLWVVDPR